MEMARQAVLERIRRVRGQGAALAARAFYEGLGHGFGRTPVAWPSLYGVEVAKDVRYGPDPAHRLDVYRPRELSGPAPAVLYVHGGAFQFMSKETHWVMGLFFASQGYVVFNADYRLAPRHRFPAAHQDALAAYQWVLEHGPEFGASRDIVVAGESAGANLVLGIALASCSERPEPWAREIFELQAVPRAVCAYCGLLQLTEPERYSDEPWFFAELIRDVAEKYLPEEGVAGPERDFADPILVLERGDAPARPFPPVVASVGTKDPLIRDTRRLERALERLGVPHHVTYHPGEMHAFQALIWSRESRRSWVETFRFLRETVGLETRPTNTPWSRWLFESVA